MLRIIKNIINKKCKHKEISCAYEPITEYTFYEYQHCHKCHKTRKIIHSLNCKIEVEWRR